MRLEKVSDAPARPPEGVLASRHLDWIPVHEEDTMPGAGEGQGRREARGPGAEHCDTEGLHERTIPARRLVRPHSPRLCAGRPPAYFFCFAISATAASCAFFS